MKQSSAAMGVVALVSCCGVAAAAPADVRVFHASPDAPNVDVLVNGGIAFADLAFGNVTDYAQLPGGTYDIEVVPAGQPGPSVIDTPLMVMDDMDYTVAAVGLLADIAPLVLVDDNTLDPANARIRFVHASPNAPAVDITLTDGTVLFGDVEFTENGGYISVPGGSYDLQVRLAGTDTVVLDVPGLGVMDNRVYTVWATGLVGDDPSLNAVVTLDAIPTPGAAALFGVAGLAAARRRR